MKRGIARSVRLFKSFLVEQSDPHVFYSTLAQDSAELLAEHVALAGATVLDVGAGPQEFAEEFLARGARYVPVDRDQGAASLAAGGLTADAHHLPIATGVIDVTFSSNLIEHVQEPSVVADELLRVTRPGGVVFISYTNWLSPWGGHETSPWHWLGGQRAIRRYTRKHGHAPKNRVGVNLFEVSVSWGLDWARRRSASGEAIVVALRPRYLPDWCSVVLKVPFVRELVTWNLLILVRKAS